VLVPLQLDRARARNVSFGFQALARLKPGVTLSQANADVERMIPIVVERLRGTSGCGWSPTSAPWPRT
jgi:hypothetical protein